MPPKRVLLVGDYQHPDFRDTVAWLQAHTQLTATAAIAAAQQHLTSQPPPAAIIIAEAHPSRFAQRQVEQLHAASPVSRLVALLGTWCEGELRSGRPWSGVTRVYWHQALARFTAELTPAARGISSLWSLPRTTTPVEQLLLQAHDEGPRGPGLVAIHTPWLTLFESLSDACQLGGRATVWLCSGQTPRLQGLSALIWDAGDCRAGAEQLLADLVARYRPPQVVALLDFVRQAAYDRVRAAGATAVLGKPLLIRDLLVHLAPAV